MNFCLIALGANLSSFRGDPAETLEISITFLSRRGLTPKARSRWWQTPADPPGAGPDYINGALLCESLLDAGETLAALHAAESELGRTRPSRWASRVCDLDLIAWNDAIAPDRATLARWMALGAAAGDAPAPDRLILPHPRMHERGFVLAPLAEIAPDWRHPLTGARVAEMLAALPPEALAGMRALPRG